MKLPLTLPLETLPRELVNRAFAQMEPKSKCLHFLLAKECWRPIFYNHSTMVIITSPIINNNQTFVNGKNIIYEYIISVKGYFTNSNNLIAA